VFSELTVGSGSTIFKANKEGVFAGAVKFSTAPFRVGYNGALVANNISINGVDVSNVFTTGGAIITDIINARINTSSKYILSDFTFGATDYAGGVKAGDITWNTSTGAVTGGSGIVINRAGIIGAKNGVAKFTIDTNGDATFAGTLSAAAGTLGTITAGTFTGTTFRTASSAPRFEIDTGAMSYATTTATVFSLSFVNSGSYGDQGDMHIGGTSKYMDWDQSAGTLTIRGTLNADDISAGTLTGRTVQSSSGQGRIEMNNGDKLYFYDGSGNVQGTMYGESDDFRLQAADDFFFYNGTSISYKMSASRFIPNTSESLQLGSDSNRWWDIYGMNVLAKTFKTIDRGSPNEGITQNLEYVNHSGVDKVAVIKGGIIVDIYTA
jgi:hypothetical protein